MVWLQAMLLISCGARGSVLAPPNERSIAAGGHNDCRCRAVHESTVPAPDKICEFEDISNRTEAPMERPRGLGVAREEKASYVEKFLTLL